MGQEGPVSVCLWRLSQNDLQETKTWFENMNGVCGEVEE